MVTPKEKPPKKTLDFPKLMCTDTSLIVLFTGENTGTVIVPNNAHTIGDHLDIWDMELFNDYEGTIELKNKREE